jgi:hypothetical protein
MWFTFPSKEGEAGKSRYHIRTATRQSHSCRGRIRKYCVHPLDGIAPDGKAPPWVSPPRQAHRTPRARMTGSGRLPGNGKWTHRAGPGDGTIGFLGSPEQGDSVATSPEFSLREARPRLQAIRRRLGRIRRAAALSREFRREIPFTLESPVHERQTETEQQKWTSEYQAKYKC